MVLSVVSVNPKPSKVTDEEIELLKSVGVPKDEEIANERARYELDRKNDPQLPEWEDWYLFGYNISNIFKPTPLKTEASSSAPEAVTESTDSNELLIDEPEAVATPTPKAKTAQKAKTAAAELVNPFDEDSAVAVTESDEPDWE